MKNTFKENWRSGFTVEENAILKPGKYKNHYSLQLRLFSYGLYLSFPKRGTTPRVQLYKLK